MEEPGQLRTERGVRWAVALYLVTAVAQLALTPPLEAPDEGAHLHYANFVAQQLVLPNQYDPALTVEGQGHSHPLYYVIAGGLIRGLMSDNEINVMRIGNPAHRWHGGTRTDVRTCLPTEQGYFRTPGDALGFYGLRALSMLFGVGTLWLVGALALALTDAPAVRSLAILLAAGLPQFTFGSASITADNLTSLLCTLTAYTFVRALQSPATLRWWGRTGVALGLAILTKKTAMFLLPAMGVSLVIGALARPRERAALARGIALVGLLVLALTEWLFARNYYLYGELLTATMEERTLPFLIAHKTLWDPYFRDVFPQMLAQSFVGVFGWLNVYLPAWVYVAWAALGAGGAVGVGRIVRRGERWPEIAMAVLFIGACLGGVVFYNLSYNQAQGRYLFTVLGWLATLVALGWSELLGRTPARARRLEAVLASALVVGQCVALVTTYWFYATPGGAPL